MLTGKLFRLKAEILAIENVEGRHRAETISEGSILRVSADRSSAGARMVEVLWLERSLAVFRVDLEERAELLDGAVYGACGEMRSARAPS